jgi:hypothetical protein
MGQVEPHHAITLLKDGNSLGNRVPPREKQSSLVRLIGYGNVHDECVLSWANA